MILYRKHRNFDILQRKLLYYTEKCEILIYYGIKVLCYTENVDSGRKNHGT